MRAYLQPNAESDIQPGTQADVCLVNTFGSGGFLRKGDQGLKGAGFSNNRAERAANQADTAIKPFNYVTMASRADLGAISCHEEAQAFLPTSAFRLLCQPSSQV